MNAPASAALLLALLASLWLLGRRRPRSILRCTDTAEVAALNRAQIQLRRDNPLPPAASDSSRRRSAQPAGARTATSPGAAAAGAPPPAWLRQALAPPPRNDRERRQLQHQLSLWCGGSLEQRLTALATSGRWRHPCMLPWLRRALRDPDPRVMAAAARAIEAFRAHPPLAASGASSRWAALVRPPRNVARTR
jgi:hypothetical protein